MHVQNKANKLVISCQYCRCLFSWYTEIHYVWQNGTDRLYYSL